MRIGTALHLLGWFLIFFALALFVPIIVSLIYSDGLWWVYLVSGSISLVIGLLLVYLILPEAELGYREGFIIVVLAWSSAGIFGALPYVFSGYLNFIDALFESVSGFTTTGSTVFEKLEHIPKSLHFWRAFTQWLGGMGMVVLSLAILPVLGIGGMQLYQAEMPGPTKDKLAPRIQDTARILWGVYLLLTVVETLMLMLGGMNLYEALCHTFTTLATGGFSTRTASIAAFNSAYIDFVITFFMFMAGVNFSLHYWALKKGPKIYFQNEEFRFYLIVGIAATLLCMHYNGHVGIYHHNLYENFRYSLFQVWSIMTTTGYGTADFDKWAPAAKILLVILMFFGGMAGSTGGGIKQVRLLIFIKFIRIQFKKLIHPRAVEVIKYNDQKVSQDVMNAILGFIALHLMFFTIASMITAAHDIDIITATSAVAATLNNIGPGLAKVGPTQNFSHLPPFVKLVLTVCMLAGRLELYTVAILFYPSYWKDIRKPLVRIIK